MCWMCDEDKSIVNDYWASKLGVTAVHFEAVSTGQLAAALLDGNADLAPDALIGVTPDEAGDSIGAEPGNPVLEVGGPSIFATVNTLGDQDYFQITLEAGKIYEIGQYAHIGGASLIPLADAYFELYDAEGNLVVSADGGGPNTPSGLDALLTFEAEESGTYYVNARAFDNVAEDGTNGDLVGDYELFAREVDPNDPSVYRPYYDTDSPLYSMDWGTQVNRVNESQRNPDGDEGTRVTGNAAAEGEVSGDAFGYAGKNVITIYFAKAGDIFTSIEDPTSPGLPPVLVSTGTQDWEKETVFTALGEFEKIADVVYVEVDTREEADFFFTTYAGTPGPGVSLLGSMSPPDYPDEGLAQFNSGDYRWTEENMQQGGFSYVTLVHEFGHGHGLAHPHDNGGRSGVMNGVTANGPVADYTTGDFALNQGVFTMMSYQDGWQSSPYGNAATDAGYGYLGGPMAFDIAILQDKYGVNEEWATGNSVYVLKDENAIGTYYSSIWDGGGRDEIVYSGARDTVIDLRPATLEYEVGGGGFVSYAYGIFGGFTIANGVVIERATSGEGNDVLTGNASANVLTANGGNDTLDGGGGADILVGGSGDDIYIVSDTAASIREYADGGEDTVRASATFSVAGQHVENVELTGSADAGITGNGLANELTGNDGANRIRAGAGDDFVVGGAGADTLLGEDGADKLFGGTGNDTFDGGAGLDRLYGESGDDLYLINDASDRAMELNNNGHDTVMASVSYSLDGQFVETLQLTGNAAINGTGNSQANSVYGNAGANKLRGDGGNDSLYGGLGADQLHGGSGQDGFFFNSALGGTNVDQILDFSVADDTIHLSSLAFAGLENGALSASAFATGTAAADADDRIVYNKANGQIMFDADGSGAGAAVLFATVNAGTMLTSADFMVYGGGAAA